MSLALFAGKVEHDFHERTQHQRDHDDHEHDGHIGRVRRIRRLVWEAGSAAQQDAVGSHGQTMMVLAFLMANQRP